MATDDQRWTIIFCDCGGWVGHGHEYHRGVRHATREVEVMPVSVLREWIEDQRHDLDQTGGLPLKAARMILSRLAARLNDPERITDA